MLTNHTAYKYETSYKGPCVITQCFTNVTVNLQYGATKIRYNIRRIKPYRSDTKVEDLNSKICLMESTYNHQLYISVYKLQLGYKVYNRICTGTLRVDSNLSYLTRREVFMTTSFLHSGPIFLEMEVC